ncbi:MAG: hypothetical protein JXA44_06755 [Methanospirillaceae archaeon]|nr:hypothetical protein [Methanospirillaceae archaeon]
MVQYLSQGYDISADFLKKKEIKAAIEEIAGFLEDDCDDLDLILSLENLYSAIGEVEEAICVLHQSILASDHPVSVIRRARHYEKCSEKKEATDEFRFLLSQNTNTQPIRERCALLASGLMDDSLGFVRRWEELRQKEREKSFIMGRNLIFPDDESNSILRDLSFKEHILGIELLLKYEVTDGLIEEVMALLSDMERYAENSIRMITLAGKKDGMDSIYPLFSHAAAFCSGARSQTKKLMKGKGLIIDPKEIETAKNALDTLSCQETGMHIAKKITEGLLFHKKFENGLLAELRTLTPGNDDPIITTLCMFLDDELGTDGEELIEQLIADNPKNFILQKKIFESLIEQDRKKDASAYAATIPEGIIPREDLLDLKLVELMDEEQYDEALTLLLENQEELNSNSHSMRLFEYAIQQYEVDFFSRLIPFFESNRMDRQVWLLKGIVQIMNQDIKRGLHCIDQAVRSGYPKADAMLVSARYMTRSGYGKRAVGICEKLLKMDGKPEAEVYPVLADAYTALGKEREASAVREKIQDL